MALFGISAANVPGQPSSELGELRQEIQAIQEGQAAIQDDLVEIKKLLEPLQPKKPAPFQPVEVSLEGAPVLGEHGAEVTIGPAALKAHVTAGDCTGPSPA